MSVDGENSSYKGFDATDHQAAYIFAPSTVENAPARQVKRRKVSLARTSSQNIEHLRSSKFEPLLNGIESLECVKLRQQLFEKSWGEAQGKIQFILGEANSDTLVDVSSFVRTSLPAEYEPKLDFHKSLRLIDQSAIERLPTGFIVLGPNIASQSLLFNQLSNRLKEEINGPVVTLRSGDASNLKAALKQLIRDATNQGDIGDEHEGLSLQHDGRKLLNYDLEILHSYVKAHGSQKAVVAFQDSEAFDTSLLAELILLFSSWLDRIPFVLLFGIATSVDLFHERLSRAATRCLYGTQFDVEQTSSVLEKIFQRVVAGLDAPIRLGAGLASSLVERQHDHVLSVQAFIASLKYAYMCHFYGNPLSTLNSFSRGSNFNFKIIQTEHLEAIRMLPSFRKLVEDLLEAKDLNHVKGLLVDDEVLLMEIARSIDSRDRAITKLLRTIYVLSCAASGPVEKSELYIKAFAGRLNDSDLVKSVIESVKRMAPCDLLDFVGRITTAIANGASTLCLDGWLDEESDFHGKLMNIRKQVTSLVEEAAARGKPLRSSYAIHNQGVRTTVVAQRVQLSYEKSTLSKQDEKFTALIDHLAETLEQYFTFENPQDLFLNEIWLYDSVSPYRDVFTPRTRFAIERALSTPHDYLNCRCCKPSVEGLSSTQPATAILYQLYLETGSLINIFDLWSAFFEIVSGKDEESRDERTTLVLFYRALADLKSLGMVKQSKKKADHLAKAAWKGL